MNKSCPHCYSKHVETRGVNLENKGLSFVESTYYYCCTCSCEWTEKSSFEITKQGDPEYAGLYDSRNIRK